MAPVTHPEVDWSEVEATLQYVYKWTYPDILELPVLKMYQDYDWAVYFMDYEKYKTEYTIYASGL